MSDTCDFNLIQRNRTYFEKGCRCILEGKLSAQSKATPDIVAVRFYEENCKCSRNYVKR